MIFGDEDRERILVYEKKGSNVALKRMIPSIDDIKLEISKICKDSSIKRVWVFGSYARNEADLDSDLDLIVDLENALDIERFDSIHNVKIDLMSLSLFNRKMQSDLRFNKRFVDRVDRERILVYEKKERK